MSDPIERQEVMDAIYKCTDIYVNNLPIMIYKAELYKAISELPSAQPEIITCKDCEYWDGSWNFCRYHGCFMFEEDGCNRAERTTEYEKM